MKRHAHGLSRYQLLTGDMGFLYPINLLEVLPGDVIQMSSSSLIRMSPMAAPVMHPITIRMHHFEVPMRLAWGFLNEGDCGASWENFITGGPDGNDATPVPSLQTTGTKYDLLDYFGLPLTAGIDVSAVPIAAFNLVFNEWFRDQDLVAARTAKQLDVPNVAWQKDYFTTCRPWSQKGADVTLPISGVAPVIGLGMNTQSYPLNSQVYETGGSGQTSYPQSGRVGSADLDMRAKEDVNNPGYPAIYADLSRAGAPSVNDVRKAFAIQRFQERMARFGSRYTEYLRGLGVRPSDARLQNPIYLGGGRSRMAISEVLQTANEATQTRFGVGDMYGHGISGAGHRPWRKAFNEHGYVVSVLSIRPTAMYGDGVDRTWLRQYKEDYWQKELEYVGQQEVWNSEVYGQTGSEGRETFGWQDRYREYREQRSHVTGAFRDDLVYWHLARKFESAPTLNEDFIKCVPSKRIYNVQNEHGLWINVQNRCTGLRPVSRSAYARII